MDWDAQTTVSRDHHQAPTTSEHLLAVQSTYGQSLDEPTRGRGHRGDTAAPYGRNAQGVPFSHRSRIVAGLLQIFVGTVGAGRFFIGHTKIGLWQTALGVGGLCLLLTGGVLAVLSAATMSPQTLTLPTTLCLMGGRALAVGGLLWTFVDGVLMLVGKIKDVHGRPLRR